jgi:hypothetical protein
VEKAVAPAPKGTTKDAVARAELTNANARRGRCESLSTATAKMVP